MMSKYLISLLFAISMAGQGVVVIPGGIGTIPGSTSSGGGAISSGTTLPASCTVGSLFFKTDATAGQNIYGCTSTNTWTLQSSSAASGFSASISSSTVLAITAGISRVGTDVTSTSASTVTISGSTASSTAYAYVDSAGVLTIGHNGAATLTSAQYTVTPGVTGFPDGSQPLFEATYVSNAWTAVTNKLPNTSRSVLTAGSGITILENAGGDQVISSSQAPVAVKAFFPLGSTRGNAGNSTTAFAANETRWQMFTIQYPITFTKILVYANNGIGASKGIVAAIANTAGTITNTTAVQTTCASGTVCVMTFGSAVSLTPGQYFYGITTDSTTFNVYQEDFAYNNLAYGFQLATGASITTMGQGTAGSGTAGTVAFGASMGTLTKWTGTDPIGKPIVVAFDN